jgi:hypothetical protein
VCIAVYVLNRCPTKSLNNITPFEAWHGRKPNVSHLRTFGCVAHVKKIGPRLDKLADRSAKMIFIGYESGTKGYIFFNPATYKLVVSRDVVFDEGQPWDWDNSQCNIDQQASDTFIVHYDLPIENLTIVGEVVHEDVLSENAGSPAHSEAREGAGGSPVTGGFPGSVNTPQQAQQTPSSQESISGPVKFRTPAELYDQTDQIQDYEYSGVCMLAADEPVNVEQALEEECWRQAMRDELEAIVQNKTWEFSELPSHHKAIGLKWVFKVKRDPAGNVVKHKARLVVKGYAQIQGIDYDDVYAPVARLETVRFLLALAVQGDWQVHHMDVKSAFLNGNLLEEVYVQQPPGFLDPKAPRKVLKLRKALYGLKQAPRA